MVGRIIANERVYLFPETPFFVYLRYLRGQFAIGCKTQLAGDQGRLLQRLQHKIVATDDEETHVRHLIDWCFFPQPCVVVERLILCFRLKETCLGKVSHIRPSSYLENRSYITFVSIHTFTVGGPIGAHESLDPKGSGHIDLCAAMNVLNPENARYIRGTTQK